MTDPYQVAALRSEVANLSSQLQESRSERDRYFMQLAAAENRYERTRSRTIQALEARKAKNAKREGTEELQQKPSSPSVSGSVFWWEFLANLFTFFF